MIVTINDFSGGTLNIPQIGQPEVIQAVETCIATYEPEYLKEILGYTLESDFVAGLEVVPIAQKWLDLRDGAAFDYDGRPYRWEGISYAIARYVFYHWLTEQAQQSTGVGEAITNTENATRTPPAAKQARAWNEMVNRNWQLAKFLTVNKTVYDDWNESSIIDTQYLGWRYGSYKIGRSELFIPINEFNI